MQHQTKWWCAPLLGWDRVKLSYSRTNVINRAVQEENEGEEKLSLTDLTWLSRLLISKEREWRNDWCCYYWRHGGGGGAAKALSKLLTNLTANLIEREHSLSSRWQRTSERPQSSISFYSRLRLQKKISRGRRRGGGRQRLLQVPDSLDFLPLRFALLCVVVVVHSTTPTIAAASQWSEPIPITPSTHNRVNAAHPRSSSSSSRTDSSSSSINILLSTSCLSSFSLSPSTHNSSSRRRRRRRRRVNSHYNCCPSPCFLSSFCCPE